MEHKLSRYFGAVAQRFNNDAIYLSQAITCCAALSIPVACIAQATGKVPTNN